MKKIKWTWAEWKKLSEYGAKGKWGVLREGGGGRVGEFGRVGPVVVSQDTWGKQSGYIRQGANKSGHKRTYLDTWVWGTTNNESLVKIYEAQGSIKKFGSKDKKFRQVKNSVVSHLNHLFNLWHSAYFGNRFLGRLGKQICQGSNSDASSWHGKAETFNTQTLSNILSAELRVLMSHLGDMLLPTCTCDPVNSWPSA